MVEAIAGLAIPQGDTFQYEFAPEIPVPVITPPGGSLEDAVDDAYFELSYLLNGDARYPRKHVAHAAMIGNTCRLTITKEGSDLIGRQNGSWSVFLTIQGNRWRVANGSWRSVGTSRTQTAVELAYENPDGPVEDFTALADATVSASTKRAWVAHGRVRSAIRISDYARMPREERRFRATGLAKNEAPVCVQADATTLKLWTATKEGGLYVDSIVDQTAPVEAATPYVLTLGTSESIVDLAVWGAAGEEVCVLLTSSKLLTFKIVAGAIALLGSSETVTASSPMTDTNVVPDNSITQIRVIGLERVEVNKDSDGKLVGYVRVNCLGYESLPLNRPFPTLVVLCDLNLAGGFSTPRFKQDTGVFTYHVFYNPFPVHPINYPAAGLGWPNGIPSGAVKNDYMVEGMQAITFAGVQYLYVAHGRRNQVRVLDVSHAFTAGIVVGAIIPCHPDFGTDPALCMDLTHVSVDPSSASRFVVIERDNEGARLVDTGLGTFPLLEHNRFAEGPIRGAPVIALAGKPFTLWTLEFGASGYTYKIFDASGASLSLLHRGYWYMNIDGIRKGRGREIWTLNFGGVIRYIRNGDNGEWFPDAASYQPSEVDDPANPGALLFAPTEYLEFAQDVGGIDMLVTSTGFGGFMEFHIDPTTRAAQPAIFNPHPNEYGTLPWMQDWANLGLGTYYANEIAHVVLGEEHFVLYDMTNRAAGKYGLFAHRYDRSARRWVFHDAQEWGSELGYAAYAIPFAQNVTAQFINGQWYCTVCAPPGIAIIHLDPLGRLERMRIRKFFDFRGLISLPPATFTYGCNAMCLTEKHMIVSTFEPSAQKLWVFKYDDRTGIPLEPAIQTIAASSVSLPSPQNWDRLFYLRYVPLGSGRGAIYAATSSGTLLEFEYTADSAAPLRFVSSMQSDYQRVCADLSPTDIGDGPEILLGNNTEGFAIAYPSLK